MKYINITKIIHINALRHKATQTRLVDECDTPRILNKLHNTNIDIDLYDVYNKKQLIKLLHKIRRNTTITDGIILHIESHGLSNQYTKHNIPILPTIEINGTHYMPMHECLKLVKRIHRKCNNKLVLFLSCCFGDSSWLTTGWLKGSAYSLCITPINEIISNDLNEYTEEFYTYISKNSNITNLNNRYIQKRLPEQEVNTYIKLARSYYISELSTELIDKEQSIKYDWLNNKRQIFSDKLSLFYPKWKYNIKQCYKNIHE